MRSGWSSKSQQRQMEASSGAIQRLQKVGRMHPLPMTNMTATSDLKTRGAAISFNVQSIEGVDSFVLMRNFSRDSGGAQIIHTWPVASLKTTPQTFPVALKYADADPAIAGRVAYYWVKAVPVSTRTQANVFLSGAVQFDASNLPSASQITGDNAITQSYTPTTQPLAAITGGATDHATIVVAAFQVQYPFGSVNYNSGTITPLLDGTQYYVYCMDPNYSGGAQAYFATMNNPQVTANPNLIYLGTVTTPVFGGGGTGGRGGGGGPCFTGNTRVITKSGARAIAEIDIGEYVRSLAGWVRVIGKLQHWYEGPMHDMGFSEQVTPGHRIFDNGSWVAAKEIWPHAVPFKGRVYNLQCEGADDYERCYKLLNGRTAHNVQKL